MHSLSTLSILLLLSSYHDERSVFGISLSTSQYSILIKNRFGTDTHAHTHIHPHRSLIEDTRRRNIVTANNNESLRPPIIDQRFNEHPTAHRCTIQQSLNYIELRSHSSIEFCLLAKCTPSSPSATNEFHGREEKRKERKKPETREKRGRGRKGQLSQIFTLKTEEKSIQKNIE